MQSRFRGFLPVVVDVETAGFDPKKDALLELAGIILALKEGRLIASDQVIHHHITPFPNANLDPACLEFTGIDPFHPFRFAVSENDALTHFFSEINKALVATGCERAVLVGHNPMFDLSFIQAAAKRCKIHTLPFHRFTTFDTATLSGVVFGETVLAKAVKAAGLRFESEFAHSALYDATVTAKLFCKIINRIWAR